VETTAISSTVSNMSAHERILLTATGEQHQLAFQCPGTNTWCCNKGDIPHQVDRINRTNTACCSVTELLFKAPAPSVYATAAYLAQSGIPFSIATLVPSTPTTSASSTNGAQASTSATSHSTSSSALTIGLGAGLGGGAAIILALGWVLMLRRWRRSAGSSLSELPNDDHSGLTKQDLIKRSGSRHFELADSGTRYELQEGVARFELQGRNKPYELQEKDSPTEKMGHMDAVELPVTPERQ
jgi:hypothetical protein